MSLTLVVIDMQNGFCRDEGSARSSGMAIMGLDGVIDQCAELIRVARSESVPIVYTRHTYRPGHLDAPPSIRHQLRPDAFLRGSWDAAIVDELCAEPHDSIVDKARFDAFLYTDLELVLRSLETTHVVIAGIVTNMCVESTARAAQQRDFGVTVARDATAATEERFHEASLAAMRTVFIATEPWRSVFAAELH